jgi:hypothetical protein
MRHNYPSLILAVALALVSLPSAWAASTFVVLYNFTGGNDGGLVASYPVLDPDGNVYGVTYWGGTGAGCGSNGCGVLFELALQANGQWTESTPFDFTKDSGGASPHALLFDGAGYLIGGTVAEAPGGPAPVFQLISEGGVWNFNPIYEGGGTDLVLGPAGSIYGVLGPGQYQAGAIGELSPGANGWTYTELYSFGGDDDKDGYEPLAPLSWDAKGNLYGTTYWGGGIGLPNCIQGLGCGVAFELSRNRSATATGLWTYHVMHRFASTSTDGQNPNGGLTLDGQGNAYGTTPVGGAQCAPVGCGTIFKLTPFPAGPWLWTETILYDFPALPACSLGCAPAYNLVFDKAGNLYGVAGGGNLSCGGTCGVVFKMTPGQNGQWSYSVIHEFDGTDGSGPLGLAIDGNGNLFGTTMTGGTYNLGVAFEITP